MLKNNSKKAKNKDGCVYLQIKSQNSTFYICFKVKKIFITLKNKTKTDTADDLYRNKGVLYRLSIKVLCLLVSKI